MNKIKAVIIEDEFPAARLLNKMIQKVRPEWEVSCKFYGIHRIIFYFRNKCIQTVK